MSSTCRYMSGRAGRGPVHDRGVLRGPPGACLSMEGGQLQTGGCRKFPVWIIEHVWVHKLMDIQQVVDPSSWPEVDSQPLSLQDSWRLRVASAQAYSIVKSRDMEKFETALDFLESTYRLLPGLVAAIKHMKIMFGLKTMVVMWMLREGRGMVRTVSKIGEFFPNKLPQYQHRCSQREMFLMRKNHADFKSFAQTLAINKSRLEAYMKSQMEEQYGERYACKVEDRLLDYLQELETALPGETHVDQIMKKESPATEEEKLLLEVMASDSATIGATLRKLLRCDGASCRPAGAPGAGASGPPTPPLQEGSSTDSSLLLGGDAPAQPGGGGEASPQFCSRHQRWVWSILGGCPDEEELPSSPLLFPSSSTSSSQDLTPSNLAPSPPDKPPSQTPAPPQTAPPAPGPALLSPVVRLVDIAPFWSSCPPHRFSLHSSVTSVVPETHPAPVSQDVSMATRRTVSKLSRRFRRAPPQTQKPSYKPESPPPSSAPAPPISAPKALQPYVSLARLSSEECLRATAGRAGVGRGGARPGRGGAGEQSDSQETEEDTDSSFDVNSLFSSDSSSSEEDGDPDPDYRPHINRSRLVLEYELARRLPGRLEANEAFNDADQ